MHFKSSLTPPFVLLIKYNHPQTVAVDELISIPDHNILGAKQFRPNFFDDCQIKISHRAMEMPKYH